MAERGDVKSNGMTVTEVSKLGPIHAKILSGDVFYHGLICRWVYLVGIVEGLVLVLK